MPNDLAPIGLSVYGRLQHLQQTIEALKNNVLARDSDLYIFSDGPKPGDEDCVAELRGYLRTIDGFKNVFITERTSNGRVANSRGGLRSLLDRFGRVIFLAEDIVTAPGFLTFMNQSLEKYEDNQHILSVVGYCPPIVIPIDYSYDAFVLRRFSAWGFGIWKNRYERMRYLTPDEYEQLAADEQRVNEFVKAGGKDMMLMLRAEAYGEIDAADVKFMYAQYLSDQYTIYPRQSLVQNIGHDGTGVHCVKSDRFNVALCHKTTFVLPEELNVDPRLVRANLVFRDGSAD